MADEQLNQTKIQKVKIPKENKKMIVETPIDRNTSNHQHSNQHDHSHEDKPLEKDSKIEETKKEVKKAEKKIKKYEASVYTRSANISLKQAVGIGRFIKYRKIDEAIKNLERVVAYKIAIPFKGEMAHRKGLQLNGKKMMTGKYPINASKEFIILLKSLSSNSSANGMDLDKTVISEVIANKAPTQHHRFGNTIFKRTHVLIKSKEMNKIKSKEKK